MQRSTLGFSILELLVVVSVIAILVTLTVVGLGDSQEKARDAKRQADLQTVATALELYKNRYGHYPSGCNASTTSRTSNSWSGEIGTGHQCGSGNEYIVNLAPEFIQELPYDPMAGRNGDSGYVYTTNVSGSAYKFMALDAVEGETVELGHQFHRCGSDFDPSLIYGGSGYSHDDPVMCRTIPTAPSGNYAFGALTEMPDCGSGDDAAWESTYAVSAGFADDRRSNNTNTNFPYRADEFDVEIVRCK